MKPLFLFFVFFLPLALSSSAQDDVVDQKLQVLAKQLATAIKSQGKTRVAVTDFTDLQNIPTELGKYLAVEMQGNLVNNGLRVVNRERVNDLLAENAMTTKGLLDPKNATKLQQAIGIEVVVIGTTTIFDKNLNVNVLALDLEKAEAIASAKTSVPKTPSIDILIATALRNDGANSGTIPPPAPPKPGPGVPDGERTLPKSLCENASELYGSYCFENRFNEPILLYEIGVGADPSPTEVSVLIAPGASACSPLVHLSYAKSKQFDFRFQTTTGAVRKGFVTLAVEACKEKRRVVSPSNFLFKAAKPD